MRRAVIVASVLLLAFLTRSGLQYAGRATGLVPGPPRSASPPAGPTPEGPARAPSVIGRRFDAAMFTLAQRGFPTTAVWTPDRLAPRGVVLRQGQDPVGAPGASAHPAQVNLVISAGWVTSCPGKTPRSDLRLETPSHRPAFIPDCLFAPAGRSLTIRVRDNLSGIPVGFSIYPSETQAYVVVDGSYRVGRDNRLRALFHGETAENPGTILYRIRPLPPGTYYFQSDGLPAWMHGYLVVKPS